MGFYFLNICVDTPDPNPEYIPEDLTINDQESIIEIIVEQIMGYENAIEEFDDNDTEDHNTLTITKINLINRYLNDINIKQLFIETKRQKFPDLNAYLTNGFHQLDTPPPKI